METLEKKPSSKSYASKFFSLETLASFAALVSGIVLIWDIATMSDYLPLMIIAGVLFTLCIAILIRLVLNPDTVRARQTDEMLKLAGQMVDLMIDGMTPAAAQSICELLLPSTAAAAVAVTDTKVILGYAGYLAKDNPQGADIRTQSTHAVIDDGVARILTSPEEIGFPQGSPIIKSAIIVPLKVGREIRGTIKFYYRSPTLITETQKSIALGFGKLLATEMAASELEDQRELATSMELKMLQNQINPHFLFNTINTIASLIRTDPPKARVLLRDFATFYRAMLENTQDRIPLTREIEQTQRYFSFEVARFGEERLELTVRIQEGISTDNLQLPPFLVQPLVENAVKHAMPPTGKLIVFISVFTCGPDVYVSVQDNGVGMDEQAKNAIMHPQSQTGLGIAVKNVHDRLHGFFGEDAQMLVESKLGEGTAVTLLFPGCAPVAEGEDFSDYEGCDTFNAAVANFKAGIKSYEQQQKIANSLNSAVTENNTDTDNYDNEDDFEDDEDFIVEGIEDDFDREALEVAFAEDLDDNFDDDLDIAKIDNTQPSNAIKDTI
jgi:two-component system sensor histidine kinase LytS